MTTRPITVGLAALTISAGLAACGSAPTEAPAGAAAAAPAAAAVEQTRPSARNACAFVDRAEIEKMAGKALNVVHDVQEENQSACEFTDPESKITIFAVTVLWAGGKEQARVEQAGASMAKQMMQEQEDVDILELTGSEKVRGLADKAFYSDVLPSWIVKGDVMVQTIAPTWERERTKKAFVMTARKAVSMLGS